MNYLFFRADQRSEWGKQFNQLFPSQALEAIAEADRWCARNHLVWKGIEIDLGDPVNWLHNPTGDKEFTWGINRFKHLRSLGIAYACTGDEKYAARALEHITGWIDTQPCPRDLPAEELTYFQRPGPWRLLETGLRLRQWVYAYHFFQGSDSWSGDSEQRFYESVKEHAWFLSTYTASIEINHSIMHMIGLLSAGLTFDSWEDSERWRTTAVERLEDCIRVQVLQDGVHTELTPHYHMVSLELFVDCAVMLKKRGLAFSAEYERILAGMMRFAGCMTRQDGTMAPFADSYANQPPDLNAAALYYNDAGWVLEGQLHEQFWTVGPERIIELLEDSAEHNNASSSSNEVKLPFAFPEAGYYGLGNAEQKLIFDAAALGGPHGHADALSFEWCAFGEALFVDPGTYTYMETPWRKHFKSTAAHNTVLVDGQDQTPYLRTQRWGVPEAEVSLLAWEPETQMVCAEHDGYSGRGIKHRRAVWFLESGEWVIYDRLTGADEHTFQHRLHTRLLEWNVEKRSGDKFAPYYGKGGGLADGPSTLGCEMLVFGPEAMEFDVEDSWESVHPMTMQPLKVLQSLLTAKEGAWFITVLRPCLGNSEFMPSEWSLRMDARSLPVLSLNRANEKKEFHMPE
ncbi:alginate lyase family protein [Paenibacillus sinopodophylli]|uniref:alginate lyase family protein n=1 Tax=Paenibacillus sinopodophylli TaxID=1837342 RepID=UPI00110D1BB6|nr:alginate lyase family protein [Paenibacillus sinopodophylli]